MPSADVVVAGGGIAGLATAFELQRRGVAFVLLESAACPGGVIRGEQIDGFTIDGGPDALLVQKPDGIRLCEALGLGHRLVATRPPRLAFVQRAGRLYPLPAASVLGIPTAVGPFLRTRLFTWAGKIRMGAELFVTPRREEGDESIAAFMLRRFGREALDYLAEPLLAGIHAGDVERLSIRALFPRLVEAERRDGSVLRAFRTQARAGRAMAGATGGDGTGLFRSLPGGLTEIVRALTNALPSGSIRVNAQVDRVAATLDAEAAAGRRERSPAPRFRVHTTNGQAIDARAVVLATPAHVTSRIAREVNPELGRLCGEVPYASTATVALAFRRSAVAHPLLGSGFVVPRVERTGILAATWLSSKWPHRAPPDAVLVRAFVGGGRDPKALERTDAELVTLSRDALAPLLGISGDALFARVYRFDRASAQHEVGHLARLDAIERSLDRTPGVFVTGSGFRGVGIPDCVADARVTANRAADWLGGPPS
jgi:oxygen-dependent protoporphyrinogen oxidase